MEVTVHIWTLPGYTYTCSIQAGTNLEIAQERWLMGPGWLLTRGVTIIVRTCSYSGGVDRGGCWLAMIV